jgi:RimJ/RimL family protein N-acetyltransferase
MQPNIIKTELEVVQSLRDLFLHENNFQFIYNKCHQFGWADTYLFLHDGIKIGYGSVWGKDKRQERDTIFEFYLLPLYRKYAPNLFPEFCTISATNFVECQSNDEFLTSMLYRYCRNINAEAILFKDHFTSNLHLPGTIFRKQTNADELNDDDGQYVLELNNEIVASGGFVWNYNLPYIDMYYEVKEAHRRKGLGSFLTQELKKEAYHLHRIPAARCNINNHISKAVLVKAGMRVCGYILIGEIKK